MPNKEPEACTAREQSKQGPTWEHIELARDTTRFHGTAEAASYERWLK